VNALNLFAVDITANSNQPASLSGVDDGSSDRFQSYFVQAMIMWQQLNNEKQVEN
jgi:hypothetical protein